MGADCANKRHGGFTLIELSIVLVIIGLIVGGILVGQNLISAAGVRATISQLEQYSTAVNTFREKYGYLPGDIPAQSATQFGFAARGSQPGQGDGNGIIEGYWGGQAVGNEEGSGETLLFWQDLSAVHMVEGNYSAIGNGTANIPSPGISGITLSQYYPQAKLGRGNYIVAFSSGGLYAGPWYSTGLNYFSVSGISAVNWANSCVPTAAPGLTVAEAYSIDKKIDDGIPTQGRVIALTLSGPSQFWPYWMNGDPMTNGPGVVFPPNQTANTPSATTCYDNGGVANKTNAYSINQNNGAGVNCALSFQFQAGD
jgi:prepilin-type N-terminal cleavage/methylation domain-containing protein